MPLHYVPEWRCDYSRTYTYDLYRFVIVQWVHTFGEAHECVFGGDVESCGEISLKAGDRGNEQDYTGLGDGEERADGDSG